MTTQDKAVTAIARSMKRNLKNSHGIEVPHSALRAVLLQAMGENPHAFVNKNEKPAHDVMASLKALQIGDSVFESWYSGRKQSDNPKQAARDAYAAGMQDPLVLQALTRSEADIQGKAQDNTLVTRTLHLVGDDVGVLSVLSLDYDGLMLVPEDWGFEGQAAIQALRAEIPKVSRYGLPDYLSSPQAFFKELGLEVSEKFISRYIDLGDDSGDSAWMEVTMPKKDWDRLLTAVLNENREMQAVLGEWVGTHYGKNFDRESEADRLTWFERYLELHNEELKPEEVNPIQPVRFEWVWPDEDSDSVVATVDLRTGRVTAEDSSLTVIPEEAMTGEIRVRIWDSVEECENTYDVFYRRGHNAGWFLYADGLQELCAHFGYMG